MDTVTQIALGTVIAEAFFRKQLGYSSLLFGGFCGWLPDIDVFFFHDWDELEYHRSLTHSLLFLPLITPLVGEIGVYLGKKGTRSSWYGLTFWSLVTHPLLDWNTSYGTKLLYPLSNHRFAIDSVGIIDLIYTIPLLYIMWAAYSQKTNREGNRKRAQYSLFLTTGYLGLGLIGSQMTISRFHEQLHAQQFTPISTRCNPLPLFSPLRRMAAMDAEGNIAIGLGHVFQHDVEIEIAPNTASEAAKKVLETTEGEILSRFAFQILRIVEEDDRVIYQASMYGLLSDPWNSPFSAEALRTNGSLSSLNMRQRALNIDIVTELRLGMHKTFFLDIQKE